MKYFTRAWTRGESDKKCARTSMRYVRRLQTIWSRLPRSMQRLARRISIHDGRPRGGFYDSVAGLLELRLRCDDRQGGEIDLVLRYHAAEFVLGDGPELADILNDPETEFYYDEVDLRRDSRLEHRVLFFPRGEVAIRFRRLGLVRTPPRLSRSGGRAARFVVRPPLRRRGTRTS